MMMIENTFRQFRAFVFDVFKPHFPPKIHQTAHTHPSSRMGMVVSGSGTCHLEDRLIPLEAGDVFVIPAGTGHEFVEIPDHATYITFRVDPDKVVALMSAEDSAAYLEERL